MDKLYRFFFLENSLNIKTHFIRLQPRETGTTPMGHLLIQYQELEGCKLSVQFMENYILINHKIEFYLGKKYDVILLSKSKYLLGT